MPVFLAIIFILAIAPVAGAEHGSAVEEHVFFSESAWNRSDRVFQYNAFSFGSAFACELAQEWAGATDRHQFGLVLPLFAGEVNPGVGDATLSYRYQLWGGSESTFAVAPRVSLILPTRSVHLGEQSTGVELAVPMSVAIGKRLVTHSRGSVRWTASEDEPELTFNQALAFTPVPRVTVSIDAEYRLGGDAVTFRPAIQLNLEGPRGLRIGPGIAVPMGGERPGVLLYVAVEHLFGE